MVLEEFGPPMTDLARPRPNYLPFQPPGFTLMRAAGLRNKALGNIFSVLLFALEPSKRGP